MIHDPADPRCWLAHHQLTRVRAEFGLEVEWRLGYCPSEPDEKELDQAFAEAELTPFSELPVHDPSRRSLLEVGKLVESGRPESIDRAYRLLWRDGRPEARVATAQQPEIEALPVVSAGDRELKAPSLEQLRKLAEELGYKRRGTTAYGSLVHRTALASRPRTFINMVATIDGKTVVSDRQTGVMSLGSDNDYATLRQIELSAQAVCVGAGNLRAEKRMWFPKHLLRFVVTNSGNVPADRRFFTDAPDKAFVVTSQRGEENVPEDLQVIVAGQDRVEPAEFLRKARERFKVDRLLIEGGSELNAGFLRENLIDELFLTMAPKIKLGRELPTYAGGEPLAGDVFMHFRLAACRTLGDEVYLRYVNQNEDEATG